MKARAREGTKEESPSLRRRRPTGGEAVSATAAPRGTCLGSGRRGRRGEQVRGPRTSPGSAPRAARCPRQAGGRQRRHREATTLESLAARRSTAGLLPRRGEHPKRDSCRNQTGRGGGTRQPSARPRQRGRGEDAGESPLPRRGQRGRERGPGMPRSGGPGPDFPPRAVAAAVRVSQHQGDRVGRPRAEGALTPSYAQRHPRLPRAQRDRVTQRGQDSVQHWRRSPPPPAIATFLQV